MEGISFSWLPWPNFKESYTGNTRTSVRKKTSKLLLPKGAVTGVWFRAYECHGCLSVC